MSEEKNHMVAGKAADARLGHSLQPPPVVLPVRLLDTNQNKWTHGSLPFDFPPDVTRFRLEFACFVGEKSENLDVDISAFLFDAKGGYIETVGYGCPASMDGGIIHKEDKVQPEAGRISEDIDFDLSVVHKRVFSACLLATTYGQHTFASLRSIKLRILAPSHLLSDSLEREISRIEYTREGCFGRKDVERNPQNRRTNIPNVIVLGDIRRVLSQDAAAESEAGSSHGPREAGPWNLRAPNVIASHVDSPEEAIPLVQCYLREWIPSIEVIGQELLIRRVYDIVSFLPVGDLELLKAGWVKGGSSGVTKDVFLGNMLRVLLRTHTTLRDERQRFELTSLLSDLFDQISGSKSLVSGFSSGSDTLAWEQFTTFWVEAATINTHSQALRCWADETLQWEMDPHFELAIRKPTKLISLPLMHLIVGLEERGSFVSMLNGATGRPHVTLCPSSLQTVTTGGLHPQESFLTVLDVECVDTKGIIIISSTDHAISIWHYNHGSENAIWRCSLHSRSAQILVSWVAHERGFLISAGVDHAVTAWCVERQMRLAVMQGHRARVTGVTYIPQHGQFATCAFDKTVRLWDAENFTSVAEMKRRSPIKFVDSRGDFVLCITLEVEAHVLSVSTRKLWCRLVGHNHLIVGAAMVHFVDTRQGRQTRTITGDQAGEFFIWDIGNGQAKNGGCAEVMQMFSVYKWRPNLGEIIGFERFHRHLSAVNDNKKVSSKQYGDQSGGNSDNSMSHIWPDILVRGVGDTMVVRTRQLTKDARAANVLVYNDKSMDLIASTGHSLRFWNLQTSDPLRMIPSPCPLGVTAMTTDKPDPRRIYLGTSDGGIAVVHIVTGQLLFEVKNVHSGAVVLVVVCSATREVVSVGIDRRVVIHRKKPSGIGLVLAGGIEEAHKTSISACAVSQEAQLIATAAGGEIRLWHKQDLSFQGGISDLDADVLGLVFLPSTACLLASDSGGEVVLWVADFDASCSRVSAAERPSAPTEEAEAEQQHDGIIANGSRSAPAWEADAEFAAGVEEEEMGAGAAENAVVGGRSGAGGSDGLRRSHDSSRDLDGTTSLSKVHIDTVVNGRDSKKPKKKRTSKPVATLWQTGSCTLRPGLVLSSRRIKDQRKRQDEEQPQQPPQEQQQQQHHHHHPSPVYEIHIHSMNEGVAPAVSPLQSASPRNGREGVRTSEGGTAPTTEQPVERPTDWTSSAGDSAGNPMNSDLRERRTKQLLITGSAGGWVEVWEAGGLLAAAGVDEEAMAAKLLRRQPPERGAQGVNRHRRSGLTCCPPPASSVPAGGSTSTTVKGVLEGLKPIPPSLRWEAHNGSPVSTLCALDKTPLLATASTDSTVKLFTLADVQVGAQPFKAAANLGKIDMRDSESVRKDRAELWSCPSLTAADVRSATEVAAYRALSEHVCAEIEEQASQGPPSCMSTMGSPNRGAVSGENKRQDVYGSGGSAADLSNDNTTVAGQGTPSHTHGVSQQEKRPTGGVVEQGRHGRHAGVSHDDLTTGSTFLTAVQQPGGQHLEKSPFSGGGGNSASHDTSTISHLAVAENGAIVTDRDDGTKDPARQIFSDFSRPENTSKKRGNVPPGPDAPGGEPRVVRSEANGIAAGGRLHRGPGRLWDQGQSPSDSFDKQRVTITSARAAKNHFGKVLYGNMYSEIKSGAACNTLVAEYVLRKNARGDAKLDMEVSPFLRDNLQDPLPSLDKRLRRRRRRQAPTAGAATAAPPPLSSDVDCFDAASSTVMGDPTKSPDVADSVRETSIAGNKHGDGGNDSDTQDSTEYGRFPQAHRAKTNGKLGDRDGGIGGGSERIKRVLRRPAHMEPVDKLTRRNRSGGTARYLDKRQSPQRSWGGDGDTQRGNADAETIRTADKFNNGIGRRRRRVTDNADNSARGNGVHKGDTGRRITTSASLKTISLREMGELQDNSRSYGNAEDALDRLLYLKLEPGERLRMTDRTLTKSESLPSAGLQERWKQIMERFDSAISPGPLDGPPTTANWNKFKSKTISTVGKYIRQKPENGSRSLGSRFEETDEALLSVTNFGTYSRSEVEALGGVFLMFAREGGNRFTYDMWRNAMLSNNGVRMLKGLQFGMLDEDNDGEVSLGDISRAVFRRAGDRDLLRIHRFLELWIPSERQKYQRHQVRKVIKEKHTVHAVEAATTTTPTRHGKSFSQPGDRELMFRGVGVEVERMPCSTGQPPTEKNRGPKGLRYGLRLTT